MHQTLMKTVPVGKLDLHHQIPILLVADRTHRQSVEIVDRVSLLLPAVGIERLLEVAFLVQQTDRDQRNASVAGGLQMIAGEHTQTPSVDGHAFHHAVLHGKVSDQPALAWFGTFNVGAEPLTGAAVGGEKPRIGGGSLERSLRDAP